MGPIQDSVCSIRPPNSDQDTITTPHQLGIGGQGCSSIQNHEGGYGQAVINLGPFGVGLEGAPGLAPQAEPLLIKITHKIIQEGNHSQEYHQVHKTPPLCFLTIWEVPQDTVEDKVKLSGGSISKLSETRTGATTLIENMVSFQPGLTPQVTGDLTHVRFLEATVFMDHYSD